MCVYSRLYLCASSFGYKAVTLLNNCGHMSSPFMFYEGDGRGLVHSVSERHNKGTCHLIAHLLCFPFLPDMFQREALKRWRGEEEDVEGTWLEDGARYGLLSLTSATPTMARGNN